MSGDGIEVEDAANVKCGLSRAAGSAAKVTNVRLDVCRVDRVAALGDGYPAASVQPETGQVVYPWLGCRDLLIKVSTDLVDCAGCSCEAYRTAVALSIADLERRRYEE